MSLIISLRIPTISTLISCKKFLQLAQTSKLNLAILNTSRVLLISVNLFMAYVYFLSNSNNNALLENTLNKVNQEILDDLTRSGIHKSSPFESYNSESTLEAIEKYEG